MSKRLKKEEPQLQKNDCCTVVIEDMSANGEGIGKYCGYTLFVKDAVIGDEALVRVTRAKKQYGYARLEQLITPSKNRVEAVCEHHKRCGGCQIQALAYEQQLMFKRNKIENNLRRLGGLDVRVETMVGMEQPFYYRNKTQIPFGRNKEGKIVAGFYAGRTHSIVDCEDCALAAPVTGEIVRRIKRFMEECSVEPYDERTGQGIVRHSLIRTGWYTGQIMVCIVINADRLPRQERLVQSLSRVDGMTSISLSINKENTNVVMGNEVRTIWGSEVITDRLEDLTFAISPLSFFQVNTRQAERLYQKALEFAGLTGTETVWDLYCGIGTISLFWRAGHARFTESRLCRRPLRMPMPMQGAMVFLMWSFLWVRPRRCCPESGKTRASVRTLLWWILRGRAVMRSCCARLLRWSRIVSCMSAVIRPRSPEI